MSYAGSGLRPFPSYPLKQRQAAKQQTRDRSSDASSSSTSQTRGPPTASPTPPHSSARFSTSYSQPALASSTTTTLSYPAALLPPAQSPFSPVLGSPLSSPTPRPLKASPQGTPPLRAAPPSAFPLAPPLPPPTAGSGPPPPPSPTRPPLDRHPPSPSPSRQRHSSQPGFTSGSPNLLGGTSSRHGAPLPSPSSSGILGSPYVSPDVTSRLGLASGLSPYSHLEAVRSTASSKGSPSSKHSVPHSVGFHRPIEPVLERISPQMGSLATISSTSKITPLTPIVSGKELPSASPSISLSRQLASAGSWPPPKNLFLPGKS